MSVYEGRTRSDFTSANETLAIFREKKGIHGAVGAFPIFAQCIRGVLQRVCENDASQESRYSHHRRASSKMCTVGGCGGEEIKGQCRNTRKYISLSSEALDKEPTSR